MNEARHLKVVEPRADEAFAELIDGVARRDRRSLGAFFDRFEPDVNRLVWRLLGADADHDDVVNAAFEVMVRRVAEVRVPAALPGWVRQVTVNEVRMTLRRRRWQRFFSFGDDAAREALQHPDLSVPDDAERERLRALYRALAQLDADDRATLVLRHLEGLELTECAEATGTSLSTLKRRLDKAEARLAALLSAGGHS